MTRVEQRTQHWGPVFEEGTGPQPQQGWTNVYGCSLNRHLNTLWLDYFIRWCAAAIPGAPHWGGVSLVGCTSCHQALIGPLCPHSSLECLIGGADWEIWSVPLLALHKIGITFACHHPPHEHRAGPRLSPGVKMTAVQMLRRPTLIHLKPESAGDNCPLARREQRAA